MMADGGALLLNKTLLERAAGTSIDTDEERVNVYWTLMIKKKVISSSQLRPKLEFSE